MTPNHLASNGSTHLRRRFRFALGPQTAGDLVKIGCGKTWGGMQQNSIAAFLTIRLSTKGQILLPRNLKRDQARNSAA